MQITEKLSEFLADMSYSDMNGDDVTETKYRILDWMGCAIGGAANEKSARLIELYARAGGKEEASIIMGNLNISSANAAFVNGVLGHTLEYDDVQKRALTHPGAVAVPVSLASVQAWGESGKALLLGVAAGYEIMIRLGEAVNPSHYRYWHTTGTCGAFAAAAASSVIMKLDSGRIKMALGIAGTMAAGLVCTFGTDAKMANVGNACHSGILAANLAYEGFTAPTDVIEGEKGFMEAMSEGENADLVLDGIGDTWKINSAMYKIHGSCAHTHPVIDALLCLRDQEEIKPEQVESIQIDTFETAVRLTGDFKNSSAQAAKFSIPYCAAAALLYGRVTVKEFENEVLYDSKLLELSKKVTVREWPESTQLYPNKRLTRVAVSLGDRLIEKTVEMPDGSPDKSFIEEKFMTLAGMYIKEIQARDIKNAILSVEDKGSLELLYRLIKNKSNS